MYKELCTIKVTFTLTQDPHKAIMDVLWLQRALGKKPDLNVTYEIRELFDAWLRAKVPMLGEVRAHKCCVTPEGAIVPLELGVDLAFREATPDELPIPPVEDKMKAVAEKVLTTAVHMTPEEQKAYEEKKAALEHAEANLQAQVAAAQAKSDQDLMLVSSRAASEVWMPTDRLQVEAEASLGQAIAILEAADKKRAEEKQKLEQALADQLRSLNEAENL